MKIRRNFTALTLVIIFPLLLQAQKENIDLEMVYRIKQAGSQSKSIEEFAFELTDLVGPRLTGSTGSARGNEWAKKTMEEIGLQNVKIEEARDFSRGGWDNIKAYAAMTKPYYANFSCNPVAWTGSTAGLLKSEVVLLDIKSDADLDKYSGKLAGKIILMPSTVTYEVSYTPLATRLSDEQLKDITSVQAKGPGRMPDLLSDLRQMGLKLKTESMLRKEGVAAIINSSGVFNVPRSAFKNYKSGDPEPIAEINLPVEAAGRMERLLRHDIPVEMEIEVINRFFDSPKLYNVIGEITGTDKILKNEVVLIGAHIDSYHGGTGAADNASGCIVMLEAMRILKSIGAAPNRTIRIALWGGEEQGLNGSKGYVEKYLSDPETRSHKPGWEKFAGYFNMDNGTGKYRGIYLQSNDILRPVFEEWLKPFEDMGCSTVTLRNTGGTDHLSFDAAGLPAFQFIQDGIEYGRGYHTIMDTYERLLFNDLRHNAIVTASMAWFAAQRETKLPGKPGITVPGSR